MSAGKIYKYYCTLLLYTDTLTELVYWTHARVLAWAKAPYLGQGSSFSDQIRAANNKTDAETGTAQALFNGQRMEKREPSLQINFSTQFRVETPNTQEG